MTIYIATFVILVVCYFFSCNVQTRIPKVTLLIISLLMMAFVSGARSFLVGTDSATYHDYYTWMINGSKYCPMEVGYCSINRLSVHLGLPFQTIFVIESIALFCGILAFILTFIDNKVWLLVPLIFFVSQAFFNSLNTSRQYFALGFVLLALVLYQKNKKILSLCLFLLAISIHYAAVIFIALPIIYKAMRTRSSELLVFVLYIFSLVLRFVGPDKVLLFVINLVPKYSHYLGSSQFAVTDSLQYVLFMVALPNILFIVCLLSSGFKSLANNNLAIGLRGNTKVNIDSKVLALSGSVLYLFFLNTFTGSMALSRFSDFFIFFFIQLLVQTVVYVRRRNKSAASLIVLGICILYCILCYYFIGIRGYQQVVPYIFSWQK